jgi:murein L,D-transpeptidase YcbB/YkuD
MKKILFSALLVSSQLFAELEIIDSIPLDDLSDIQLQQQVVEPEQTKPKPEEWVNNLSGIHNSVETKKSYLKGILNAQQYGEYALEKLSSEELVKRWYQKRGYETFWISSSFDINPNLFDMVEMIKHAEEEGLESEDYHLLEISTILDEIKSEEILSDRDRNLAIAQIDVLLTDAFLTMAKDLREGAIDFDAFYKIIKAKGKREEINYNWQNPKRKMNYVAILEKVGVEGDLEKRLKALSTDNELYIQLKQAYRLYKNIAREGGWKKIPRGKKLRMGNISKKRVPLLAERLYMTGDLASYDPEITVMTQEMKEALKHYQRRMGIWPSGVLTDLTRNALNVSVEKRVQKIKLNLERMRWEKGAFGPEYIFVNIPDFKMQFMRDGLKEIEMRVVVGKKENPTPVFSSTFSYVVLNPTWSVPSSIVKKEMLPRIQEDPDYLATRKFKLYKGWDKNRKEIDGFDVDWWQYDEDSNLPFSFVREPGAGNPLGNVKFMFPNKYAVYMHDTPQKKLFKNSRRAYSHGCIRLHKPQELLEYVSDRYTNTPYERVKKMQKSGKSQSLRLDYGVPVYIRYYTAWADEDGAVHFRNDIYGYDKIQYKLLKK